MPVKAALLFPGQGAQYVGMGKLLCGQFPAARDVFEKANETLQVDLRKICFEGPEKELTLTQNNQPALLTTSIACWEVLKQEGIPLAVTAAAGLSLGEYTALVAAGAMPFENALALVRARGIFMQDACEQKPGAMASVIGLNIEKVQELCKAVAGNGSARILDVANVNCPGQIVISGDREAVREAGDRISAMDSARAIPLNVAGAFHSHLMQPAADHLSQIIGEFTFKTPQFPVMSNVTGRKIESSGDIANLLVRQIMSPVLWEQCVGSILELRPEIFLELGSGKVLSGLLRKIDRKASSFNVEDPPSLAKAVAICKQGGVAS